MSLTLIESMALAALRGDLVAARALADALLNEFGDDRVPILPIQKVTGNLGRIRAVAYFGADLEVDAESVVRAVRDWLLGGMSNVLVLQGCDRIELFEANDSSAVFNVPALDRADGRYGHRGEMR